MYLNKVNNLSVLLKSLISSHVADEKIAKCAITSHETIASSVVRVSHKLSTMHPRTYTFALASYTRKYQQLLKKNPSVATLLPAIQNCKDLTLTYETLCNDFPQNLECRHFL